MNDIGCEKKNSLVEGKAPVAADPVVMTKFTRRKAESYFPSPYLPILLMVVSIFLIEVLIETSLARFFSLTLTLHVLFDAGSTVLLLLPIFYFILYRPFKRLDAERQRVQSENQLLSRKLIRRSEDEKQRLSRDLHDDFGQVLTALQFGVATLRESCLVPAGKTKTCARQADHLVGMIAQLGDQVRSLTLDLRPPALNELGLKSAILVLIEGNWGELAIEFEEEGASRRCAAEIELALYRICQEGLNNIVKHAQATRARICLCYNDADIQLRVCDNGIGFDAKTFKFDRDRRGGFGLLGLRERVASLNGQLELTSAPGAGTKIEIQVPAELQRRNDETDPSPDC